jgi:hypothetical protein
MLKCNNFIPDCLCIIASRQNREVTQARLIKELVLVSCEYFFGYASRTLHMTSAVNLVKVMQVLSNFAPAEAEPRRKLGVWILFMKLIFIIFYVHYCSETSFHRF